jgi:transposase
MYFRMFQKDIHTRCVRHNDGTTKTTDLPLFSVFIIIETRKRKAESDMPSEAEELIAFLKKINGLQEARIKEQVVTIDNLRITIADLQVTVANLNETLDEFRRKFFGISSEKVSSSAVKETADAEETAEELKTTTVTAHTRIKKPKSSRQDLYASLPIRYVKCDVPKEQRLCPDCDTPMEHLGYKFVREELNIIEVKVERIHYLEETVVCPVCREEGDTTIVAAKTPTPLMPHSPASPSMVTHVMYEKSGNHMPFYRQETDWKLKGVPLPRETAANWYNYCALEYLLPVYDYLHQEFLMRDIIHVDEVPCQVLHEKGKEATSRSYMWIYLSGTDGKPIVVLYDYQPGRGGKYPIEFLSGYTGMIHCDGYSAYGNIQDVILVCCLAHCRRKFYEAIPKERRKKVKLLDINSEQELPAPKEGISLDSTLLPAEKGVAFCNRLFFMERMYKKLSAEDRKAMRQEQEPPVWEEFWGWIDTLNPTGGSKLEKAVNYACNHHETLMNYMLDGRCEVSNNAAERRAKTYVMGRKNFLFHDTVDGARASAIVLSLIETAKANQLNVFQYLYTLLLYMPDYKNEPAGIDQLMPWSEFIKERCSGLIDTETETPTNRGSIPI